MARKADWEKFFDGHAPVYMDNCFTQNTVQEVDFLVEELQLKPGATILDVGCGTGRHAIELARRGFAVTGVDLSSGMLAEAKKSAKKAKVTVTWVHANAARMPVGQKHDAVICLCEGAFGLLGRGDDALEQPLAILRQVARALKPGGRCLFTVLNGYATARQHSQSDVEQNVFDPHHALRGLRVLRCQRSFGHERARLCAHGTGTALSYGRSGRASHLGRHRGRLAAGPDRPRRDGDHGGGGEGASNRAIWKTRWIPAFAGMTDEGAWILPCRGVGYPGRMQCAPTEIRRNGAAGRCRESEEPVSKPFVPVKIETQDYEWG